MYRGYVKRDEPQKQNRQHIFIIFKIIQPSRLEANKIKWTTRINGKTERQKVAKWRKDLLLRLKIK